MTIEFAFFRDLAYVFLAAFAGGLLAWRLRQPILIGYVLAGILISPFTPGPSVSDVHILELFAEIGVVLLMFSVGLEFSVRELLQAKWVALVGGPLGILLSIGMGNGIGRIFHWNLSQGIVVGAVISVASTMVLTRLLLDQGQLRTEAGRIMVAITLVEDLAVVVFVAVLPSLGKPGGFHIWVLVRSLGKAAAILVPVLFVAAKVVPRLLGRIARTQRRELFFILILAICLGTAALSQAAGLSLAFGAFAAGLIVSESEYAHETLAELFSLRESFVALFFVTIGLLIQPRMLISNLPLIGALILLVVVGKFAVWTGVVRVFGYPMWVAVSVAIGLTQIGEFSFVLVQVASSAGIVGDEIYNATLAASLATILLNAALVRYVPVIVARGRHAGEETAGAGENAVAEEMQNHVVLCGYGRVGSEVGAALGTFHIPYMAIEIDPDVSGTLRSRGIRFVLGNAAHPEILQRANIENASLLIVTIPDADRARLAIANARRMNPGIAILARAHRYHDYDALTQAGATEIIQPEIEAAATIIRHASTFLKLPDDEVRSYLRGFRRAMDSIERTRPKERASLPELRDFAVRGSSLTGKSLAETQIRARFSVTVVSVSKSNGETVVNPPSDLNFEQGDILRVLGLADDLNRFVSQVTGRRKDRVL